MPKQRNTDTEIWKDPWFRRLPALEKVFWRYLCDNVDDAGVWKEDLDLAAFQIGEAIDKDRALQHFNAGKERVKEFKTGYWLIIDFVAFHYGGIDLSNPTNNFHRHITSLVNRHGIQGLVSPSLGAKDKGKGIEERKDIGDSKGEVLALFDEFWKTYPARHGKKIEKEATLKEFKKIPAPDHTLVVVAARNYANSGQLPKDPKRFFKDGYWREWLKPAEPGLHQNGSGPKRVSLEHCTPCGKDFPIGTHDKAKCADDFRKKNSTGGHERQQQEVSS